MGWRRGSRCSSAACIEVRRAGDHILIRDSKQPQAVPQRYDAEEWSAFVAAVKDGEFDDLLRAAEPEPAPPPP